MTLAPLPFLEIIEFQLVVSMAKKPEEESIISKPAE